MGLLTSQRIVDPAFRQIHVRGHASAEGIRRIVVRVDQVLSHHAIIDFPGLATPLPLHAGCFVTLFRVSRANVALS